MQDKSTLILEVFRQDTQLAMSIFKEQDLASTLKHYSKLAISFAEINKLCQEVVNILNKVDPKGILELDYINRLKKTGQLLWDHLLTRTIKDKLKSAPVSDLILSIDEDLISIPWELLYDGKEFLCLKFNLGRVIRTKEERSPGQYRSFSSALKMLILANPTGDLKSAYLEGTFIKNQFDRKRKEIGIDFKSTNIDTLYVKKRLHDYDIVHFSGHCEYDADNPRNTGWVFSDGRLTAQDICAMGETMPLPSLIFSHACHSAKTSADLMDIAYQLKNYSLASAFLFSGVRHYLGTIRKIEDPVSLTLAKEFYTQLILGQSIGECLRLGRLKLIKDYGIAAISWASYLLYGDPNFVLFRTKVKPAITRPKRKIFLSRKILLKTALIAGLVLIAIYLYIWLPSINPNNYILFLKSSKLFTQGKNQEAILLASRLMQKEPLFLAAYPLIADAYQRLGDKESAIKYYFDYMRYSEKEGDKKNLVSAYAGLGWVYHLAGEYAKAFDFYEKALTLSRQNHDKLNEAKVLGRLAVWYIDKKDNDRALELLTKSMEINRERQHIYEHRYNLACDYFNIGLVFANRDDFAAAREFYTKSRMLFEKMKSENELSDCYFNLGEIYLFEKEYQKALDYYLKGLKIDRTQNNKFNLASDYNMIGELYLAMDNMLEAEKFFSESISIGKEINAQPELAATYYNLGLLYKKQGRKNKTREYFRLAQEIYSAIDLAEYQKIKKELSELN